jgi:exopolyphosphatase/guanosine-5'-triphosphate,3'-diphosphate pyrophosphatase
VLSKSKNKKNIIAAIDIGTNSFHLIVCEVHPNGQFKILDREKEIVRLGRGSSDMKHLSEPSIKRGILTLKHFKRIAVSFRASIHAVATSAVREALNQKDFLYRVKRETGISIEVASGIEEARLIHLGVLQALPVFTKKMLMIDIGGGSTEFLVGKKRTIYFSNSLKIGAVRLTQKFFSSSSLSTKDIKECRKYVKGMLVPIVRESKNHTFDVVIGSSGTILTLAQLIRRRKEGYEESSLNGFSFSRKDLFQIIDGIAQTPRKKDLVEILGIDSSRADIILAGAIILEQIFKELNIKEMMVSEFALREGIILDTIEKKHSEKSISHLGDIRYSSVVNLAQRYDFERSHSIHVAKLALSIFDQTAGVHKFGAAERQYLESAALLHEIGLSISHDQHHRHSYYLIRNAELYGYSENEKEIIAQVARYHRKSHPKLKHNEFGMLSSETQHIVSVLSGILRIADGLDRTHSSSIRSITILRKERSMSFRLEPARKTADIDLELWGAQRKKTLFEEQFGCLVHFTVAGKRHFVTKR